MANSNIILICAAIQNHNYLHIMVFRRQLYVAIEENITLPSSLLITFQGNNFRIFICKNTSHIAKKCSNPKENNTSVILVQR